MSVPIRPDTPSPAAGAPTGPPDTPEKTGLGLSLSQVLAGATTAAVAAVVGGQLGLAGTVVGAFVLSVFSGVALPLIRTSLEKSQEQLKKVVPGREGPTRTRSFRGQLTQSQDDGDTVQVRATSARVSSTSLPADTTGTTGPLATAEAAAEATAARRGKVRVAVLGTAAAFVIGVGAILGIQALTGQHLSPGTGTLQSGLSEALGQAPAAPVSPAPTEESPEPTPHDTAPATSPAETSASPEATDPAAESTPTPDPTTNPATGPAADPAERGATAPAVPTQPVAPATAQVTAPR